jgi:hypothetical protein
MSSLVVQRCGEGGEGFSVPSLGRRNRVRVPCLHACRAVLVGRKQVTLVLLEFGGGPVLVRLHRLALSGVRWSLAVVIISGSVRLQVAFALRTRTLRVPLLVCLEIQNPSTFRNLYGSSSPSGLLCLIV